MRGLAELGALGAAGAIPVLAYGVLGALVFGRLGAGARSAEAIALSYVLGTGVASWLLLVARLSGLPVPPLWALALFAALGTAALRRPPRSASAGRDPGWVRAVDAAACALGALVFAAALGPETYWDGFEYHLPLARAWSEGPLRALPGMLDAEFRAGVDLLYLPAIAAGQPDAAAAVSAAFALALAALLRGELRRRATPGAAALAAAFTLVVPFTLQTAPSSYVDLGVGAYGFLALLFADRWSRRGGERWLHASALAVAFAANAKLHAAALLPACLAVACLGGRRPPGRTLLACAAWVVALGLPWLVKGGLHMGNPFFPLLGDLFGYGWTTAEHVELRRLRLAADWSGPSGPTGLPLYLASLVAGRNPHLGGLLGPLPFALAPLAVHRLRRPTAVLVATLAVLWALQVTFMPALRFASPLLPFAALAAGVGGARLARSGGAPRLVLAAVLCALALHHLAGAALQLGPRLGAIAWPRAYERARFPDQVALAEMVARGRGVVAIPKGAALWMPRPVYLLHWERNGEIFFDRVRGRLTPAPQVLERLKARGVGSLVLDVPASLPAGGRVGHPRVDAWIGRGLAARRDDVPPRPARPGRVWVLVDLR